MKTGVKNMNNWKKISYSPELDAKWQKKWADTELYRFDVNSPNPKMYLLEMFSYPSASKLHMGHWWNYSLPDSWGELLLDRTLAKQGIQVDELTILDRLAYVGTSGMGALEYRPNHNSDYAFSGLDYDMIAEECNKVLSSQASDNLDTLYRLGGSSVGWHL